MLAPECDHTLDCNGAIGLNSVSGDQGGSPVTHDGSDSAWVRVRVTEDITGLAGVIGARMYLEATLTSPPGENFDLYLHMDPSSENSNGCGNLHGSSTNAGGQSDQVNIDWGETPGDFANNATDDRWVAIEIRAVEGKCDGSKQWHLNLQGG